MKLYVYICVRYVCSPTDDFRKKWEILATKAYNKLTQQEKDKVF